MSNMDITNLLLAVIAGRLLVGDLPWVARQVKRRAARRARILKAKLLG